MPRLVRTTPKPCNSNTPSQKTAKNAPKAKAQTQGLQQGQSTDLSLFQRALQIYQAQPQQTNPEQQ